MGLGSSKCVGTCAHIRLAVKHEELQIMKVRTFHSVILRHPIFGMWSECYDRHKSIQPLYGWNNRFFSKIFFMYICLKRTTSRPRTISPEARYPKYVIKGETCCQGLYNKFEVVLSVEYQVVFLLHFCEDHYSSFGGVLQGFMMQDFSCSFLWTCLFSAALQFQSKYFLLIQNKAIFNH